MSKHLFFINNLEMGGAEMSLINLSNYLVKKSQSVTIVTGMKKTDNDLAHLLNSKVKIISLDMVSSSYKLKALFFPNMIAKKIMKLVNVSEYKTITAALELFPTYVIQKIKHPNKIFQVHSDLKKIVAKSSGVVQKYLKRKNSNYELNCTYTIVGQNAIDIFKKYNPDIPNNNIFLVKNIIDVKNIVARANDTTDLIKSTNKKVVSIGRLVPEKAFERIIPIARLMPEVNFYLIGEGEQRTILEQLIKEAQIDNLILLGKQENPYKYLKQADLLLLTSITEGSPTVIYEALALNKPFVATDVADLKQIAEITGSCVLSQDEKPEKFVEAIKNTKINSSEAVNSINQEVYEQIYMIYLQEKE